MIVYLPSWNGDFRLEADGDNSTRLVLEEPTDHERVIIGKFLVDAHKKKWCSDKDIPAPGAPYRGSAPTKILNVKVEDASKLLIRLSRPKDRTLTAVKFANGAVETITSTKKEALDKIGKTVEEARKKEDKENGKEAKAASVKRPTPSCPNCLPGAIKPATEVLLSFLNDEQHADWAEKRAIVVEGGYSGHRYLLAHRHSDTGQKIGRMCFDLDDQGVVHFHDWSVPPEEEVLAAKLILEHREDWLRNEATCFGSFADVYKNPFGDGMDGTESAAMVEAVGQYFV